MHIYICQLCFGHNLFRLGLGCTPGMIFSHFDLVDGWTPDMAGHWPGLSSSIREVPEEFYLEVKISPVSGRLIIGHISFTHRLSIVRYPAGNQAVITPPDNRPTFRWAWFKHRSFSRIIW